MKRRHPARRHRKRQPRAVAHPANDDGLRERLAELDAQVRGERISAEPVALPIDHELATRIDAAFTAFDTQLDEASEPLQTGATVMTRLLEHAERDVTQKLNEADVAIRHVFERLRSGQLSRKQLAALARAIVSQLDQVELAVRDASTVRDGDAAEIEKWIQLVARADEHGRVDLAEAARGRVEEWRRNTRAREAAVSELLALRERLGELGRLVLELAGGGK